MGGSWFGFDRFSSRLCEKMIFYCVPWEISLFNFYVALHALRNMTKKIQLPFLTLYVLYFDAKLDLLFPTGNTWLEVGWNSFSSFAESWQDVETFLIFLSIEPRQCKHFKNWENLHQPTWSGWGKLFNRKRAFYAFSPEEVKPALMIRWENQVVQLLESILCIFKVLGQGGMKLLKEKLWREIWLKKK